MGKYCWEIRKDLFSRVGEKSMVGIIGPGGANFRELQNDGCARFRLLDDDGEVLVIGNFWGDVDSDDAFGPLEDFGTPSLGATTIQYREGDGWKTI